MATTYDSRITIEEARSRLVNLGVRPGGTVHTVLRHVSSSGMYRLIEPFVIYKGEPVSIMVEVARLTDSRFANNGQRGVVMRGTGMDMGFALVYNLSSALYPKGHRCSGKTCRSNDHSNGDRNYDGRHKHTDGGYALNHRWF